MDGRVLVCGAWDTGPGYPRTESLLGALDASGIETAECSVAMPWQGAGKRRLLRAPLRWPSFLWSLRAGRRRLRRSVAAALARTRPDAILVPYPGHLVVRDVARRANVPVVLDLFLSAYDTAVSDRGMFAPASLPARALRWLDRRACRAADLVLLDTAENARFVAELTGLPPERVAWVPVGDPAAPVEPAAYVPPGPDRPLEVLFFGTGVPLHGLATLLEAVRRSNGVRLTLVGGSPAERRLAGDLPGDKLELGAEFVSRDALQALLDRAHLVAGIFGTSDKASRVVPFKVVHGLASARPVLTADTPAVRTLLQVGTEVLVCRPGDVEHLVTALGDARRDPSHLHDVAQQGRQAYDRRFSADALGSRLRTLLAELTDGAVAPPRSRPALQEVNA